ncbi:MAG: hypothetical protein LQ346_005253 [Caloplaca aetnensis]|nr:MAG: hypothetical protein LQ346_005253 [Caloplaca aetnensis]
MHITSVVPLGLALVLPILAASAKKAPTLCGLAKLPNCSKQEICVKPAPYIGCGLDNPDLCPGTCERSCPLTSNERPCPTGQKCTVLPGISTMQTGYCAVPVAPQPAFCGGFGNIQCAGPDEICVDDPSDTCDPTTTGRDCGGICVAAPPKPVQRLCDSRGLPPCVLGETCVHDPKSPCGAAADCPGVCTPTRLCATLAGLQCAKGEQCVEYFENPNCSVGIAADCPGICVPA